jgi:hypothetical protein
MGRNIVTSARIDTELELAAPSGSQRAPSPAADNYTSQIVKLIPAEIVGVYLGLQNQFFSIAEPARSITQAIIFITILILSPFYLKIAGGITDPKQRTVAIISYTIWGISLGGPFAYLLDLVHSPVTAQQIGGGLIMLYTLVVPLIYKKLNPKI